MIKQTDVPEQKKQIEDLTEHQLDMIYSLVRIGNHTDAEIAWGYGVPESDIKKIFDNYVALRKAVEGKSPPTPPVYAATPQEPYKTTRRRRWDARYQSNAERQKAYRSRLRSAQLGG